MISPIDIKMLKDFGFRDYDSLKKSLKTAPGRRSGMYDFQWRIKMLTKYGTHYSRVSIDLSAFFKGYEDYLIRTQKENINYQPRSETTKREEYLFGSWRGNPWKKTPTGTGLWTIKDPQGYTWFRGIGRLKLDEAVEICERESKKRFPPTKPVPKINPEGTYKLKLDYNTCKASYNKYKNRGSIWMKKDWFVALMICRNITSTWDTRNGDWKPWNNKWCKIAHERPGLTINKYKLSDGKVEYIDVARFVIHEGLGGMAKGGYIIGVAFAVGGDTAGKIITGFCRDNNIPYYKL
jgi:hypothetical protein